ncbi:hypothetical protein VTJ04DRAFT_4408 [Mycothermus thermophilus]|uniref:uncharacterized protein n=1 Tax=Humicola insolens TaxID=85995 RepID=UPI003741EEE3
MKVYGALLSFFIACAAAQGAPQLPECAQNCASKFLEEGIGDCGREVKCICENKDFLDSIACCLVGVCDEEKQAQAVNFAAQLCKGFGVNDLPTSVACKTAAAPTATGDSTSTGGPAPTTTGAAGGDDDEDDEDDDGESNTTGGAANAPSPTSNPGTHPTAAALGFGAIGGVIAAAALL